MQIPKPMNRRIFLSATLAAALLAAGPAFADFEDQVRRQLQQQGFKQIDVSSTLLGRTRIFASKKDGSREIILNPRTGEILRDMWTASHGSNEGPQIAGSDGTPSNSGGDDGSSDDSGSDDSGSDDSGGDDSGKDSGGDDSGEDSGDDSGKDSGGDDGGDDSGGGEDGGNDNSGNGGNGNGNGNGGNDDGEDD